MNEIYNEAPPLSEAFYRYFGDEYQKRYEHLLKATNRFSLLNAGLASLEDETLRDQKFKELEEAGLLEPPKSPGEYVDRVLKLVEEFSDAPSTKQIEEFNILDKNLKTHCLNFLKEGQLIAFGYTVPRAPEATPIRIPEEAFSGEIHWQADIIELGSMKFEQVRVAHINWLKEFGLAELAPQKGAAGRKSRRDDILQAYEELKALNVLTGNESIKVIGEKVRVRVMQNTDCTEKGLSNQTIYDHLKRK